MKTGGILLFLFFCSAGVHAQNISFAQLLKLTTLNNDGVNSILIEGRLFKPYLSGPDNGLNIDLYQNRKPSVNQETLTIGYGVRTNRGDFLHTVTYETNQPKYIKQLLAQAASSGLTLSFSGADADKRIYLFDDRDFSVTIYINNDNSSGSVKLQQKEQLDDF